MILLLDTSTPTCHLQLVDGDWHYHNSWLAERRLAKELLGYLEDQLKLNNKTWTDITGIGVFRGPGSFTGLRIGITVLNTMADALNIPIVGMMGNNWQMEAVEKLQNGKNEHMILPEYGSEAHITTPRK